VTHPFKFGRLPGKIPVGLKELSYYVAGSLPTPPASVAVPTVVASSDGTAWGLDGNDTYGDCGVAGVNHGFMAVDAVLNYPETVPGDQDIVNYYLAYTGGQDTGVVLADFLAYVKKTGFFGHAIRAYAPVGVHDMPSLAFAIDAFDFAYTGITVTDAMMSAFQNGQPWNAASTEGQVDGGHCVPLVGYDDKFLYCVSWGQVQPITWPAWHLMSTEAWAVIPQEFATKNSDGRGINLAALEADLPKLAN
jgi:hypothetical protein